MGRFATVLLSLLALMAVPRVAWGQRVLLERPPAADSTLFEAFGRLRAELELQSFEVVLLEPQPTPTNLDELERAAQAQGAFAAVGLYRDPSGTTAEILIVDRVTGKSTTRKLLIDPSPNGPTLLAVRAADLLRASLSEYAPGERPPRDVVGVDKAPPPPELARFTREAPRFQLQAGGLLLLTPKLGYGLGPFLRATYHPLERLGVALLLSGPLHGAEFDAAEGRATARQEFARLSGGWNLSATTTGRRWQWGPILGVGLYHLSATGVVTSPLVAETDGLFALMLSGGLCAHYFFDTTVGLGLDVGAVTLLPRPRIAVDEERSSPIALQGEIALGLDVAF